MIDKEYADTKKFLDSVSDSFCLAKWTQVTLQLQSGHTHSCHHPQTHLIPLDELAENPSALHNTKYKKSLRKKMLEGERRSECGYCWRIEDSKTEQYSDRIMKSATYWSDSRKDEVLKNSFDYDINPSYLEVSFGNACNLGCLYCSPDISSTIYNDYKKHGHYPSQQPTTLEGLKAVNKYPFPSGQPNPYIDAFWSWFPSARKDLRVFRITGGEPLINPNTFRFLSSLINDPMPDTEIAVNSNLCIPDKNFQKLLEHLNVLKVGVHFKKIEIFTSVDTHGDHAEYIRSGLNYKLLMDRTDFLLEKYPDLNIHIMCTFNALSPVKFNDLLADVLKIKKQYCQGNPYRFSIDISYLYHPTHFSLKILPDSFVSFLNSSVNFMETNLNTDFEVGFLFEELNKMKRLRDWFKSLKNEESEEYYFLQHDFYLVIKEIDRRKGSNFSNLGSEYVQFLDLCSKASTHMSEDQIMKSKISFSSMKKYQNSRLEK